MDMGHTLLQHDGAKLDGAPKAPVERRRTGRDDVAWSNGQSRWAGSNEGAGVRRAAPSGQSEEITTVVDQSVVCPSAEVLLIIGAARERVRRGADGRGGSTHFTRHAVAMGTRILFSSSIQ